MVIELLGTPSCGKSTYVEKYVLGENIISPLSLYLYNPSRIKQNINKVRLAIYAWICKTRRCAELNRAIKRIRFSSKIKKLKMWLYVFSVLGAKWKAEKTFSGSDLIFDEGVNQVVWGLLYNEKNSMSKVWNLHKLLVPEIGDKIVYFVISRETLYKRLVKRNSSGGSELEHDIKTDESVLDRSIQYIEMIVNKLIEYGYRDNIVVYRGEDTCE